MLIRLILGCRGARRGGRSVWTQRQRRSFKDGSIAGLILQKRTWIKQTWYGLYNSLHPLLRAVAAFQSRPLVWETIHFHSWGAHLGKFRCMPCKPSDSVLIWLKWICLSAAVLDPGCLTRPLLRLGYSGPSPVGCQSYPHQECNSIQSQNTAGTSGDWWRHVD